MMKKVIYTLILTACMPCIAQAQVGYYVAEAARYSENVYEGTARTIAMGNAFTALGGDLGAIAINPASGAVIRRSEFSVSGSLVNTIGKTSVDRQASIHAEKTRFNVPNVGLSFNFNTGRYSGVLNYNLGIVVNRTNDFNSYIRSRNNDYNESSWLGAAACQLNGIEKSEVEKMSFFSNTHGVPASALLAWDTYLLAPIPGSDKEYIGSTENLGTQGVYVGGKLNQEFTRQTRGGAYQWTINFGGNVNDSFFFGASLNLHTLNYFADETYSEYACEKVNTFEDGFVDMDHEYSQHTSGSGVSASFGAIYVLGNLRLGAAITTPMLYSITETEEQGMSSSFNNGKKYNSKTDVRKYNYNIRMPMRYSVGAAFTFGRFGLVSVDYEGVDYRKLVMSEANNARIPFKNENNEIASTMANGNNWRFGAEINVLPTLSVRGGYNLNSYKGDWIPYRTSFSAGVSYKFTENSYVDFAYQRTGYTHSEFSYYDSYDTFKAPSVYTSEAKNRFVLTYGIRF